MGGITPSGIFSKTVSAARTFVGNIVPAGILTNSSAILHIILSGAVGPYGILTNIANLINKHGRWRWGGHRKPVVGPRIELQGDPVIKADGSMARIRVKH
jgi:hypothetical protein